MAYCVGRKMMNASAPTLMTSDTRLAGGRLGGAAERSMEQIAIDVSREQIRGGDGHDRRRHERADCDRRKRDADEPVGKLIEDTAPGTAKFGPYRANPAAYAGLACTLDTNAMYPSAASSASATE